MSNFSEEEARIMSVSLMQNDLDLLIENIQKETDFFTKAKLLGSLIEKTNIRLIDLARKLKLTPSHLCHILRLNRLAEIIVDGYYAQLISISHLFIISRLKDKDLTLKAYEKILSENLSVAATEELVRELLHGVKTEGEYLTQEEKEKYLKSINGVKNGIDAKIIQTRIRGKLIVEIKGSWTITSTTLRKLLDHLTKWNPI